MPLVLLLAVAISGASNGSNVTDDVKIIVIVVNLIIKSIHILENKSRNFGRIYATFFRSSYMRVKHFQP